MWRHVLGLCVVIVVLGANGFVPGGLLGVSAKLAAREMPQRLQVRYLRATDPRYQKQAKRLDATRQLGQVRPGESGLQGVAGSVHRGVEVPTRIWDRSKSRFIYSAFWILWARLYNLLLGWSIAIVLVFVALAVTLWLRARDTRFRFKIDTNPSLKATATADPSSAIFGWIGVAMLVSPLPVPIGFGLGALVLAAALAWARRGWQAVS